MKIDLERYDIPKNQWEHIIDQYVYNPTHQKMLLDRLFGGMTFEMIAEKYHISTQHAKSVIYKSMDRVVKHI